MSHTAKINTQFKRFEPLKTALAQFGWTIKEKSKCRLYSSDPARNTVYDYVAVNPKNEYNSYDVGIKVNKTTGELELYGDFYGGSVAATLGTNLDRLREEYAYRVMEEKYAYEGASVFRTQNQDGTQTVEVEFS